MTVSLASDKTAKITENKEKSDGDHKIYTISFEKLGRNDITITYDGDKKSVLQFWIEEPIKDALQRRTDYLMDELRITDPSDPHYNSFLEIDNELASEIRVLADDRQPPGQ